MKQRIFSKQFWLAAAERAVHTFAQTFVAAIPVTAVGLHTVPWIGVLSASGLAALISIGKSAAVGVPEVGGSNG